MLVIAQKQFRGRHETLYEISVELRGENELMGRALGKGILQAGKYSVTRKK
jgi:hypothetical protein